MRSPKKQREFRKGKPGFYPDQSIYAEFACAEFGLAFSRSRRRIGTALQRRLTRQIAAFRRRPMLVVSAEQCHRLDAGFRQIFYQQDPGAGRRARRSAVNISSCTTAIARIARRDMNATSAGAYFASLGCIGFRQTVDGIARRFRASRSRRGRACSLSRRGRKILRRGSDPADRRGNRVPDFPARRRALYCARKYPPFVLGDGMRTLRDLLSAHNDALPRPRTFAGIACGSTIRRSTPCWQKTNAATFPGG